MLVSESSFNDHQQRALKAVRAAMLRREDMESSCSNDNDAAAKERQIEEDSRTLLMYSLLSHVAHESITMGLDPCSLLRMYSSFMSQSLTDYDKHNPMLFVLPETPAFPPTSLRRVWTAGQPPEVGMWAVWTDSFLLIQCTLSGLNRKLDKQGVVWTVAISWFY